MAALDTANTMRAARIPLWTGHWSAVRRGMGKPRRVAAALATDHGHGDADVYVIVYSDKVFHP